MKSFVNFDRVKHSDEHGLACKDESRTIQSQKEEADINTIVRNFGITGQLPSGVRVPDYADFTDSITDFRTAIEAVRAAEESFAAMPSDLRKRLDYDPQQFLEFCADPANLEEMRKLGLAVDLPRPVAPGGAS